jgi:COP9 signalosome complex subunit 2
VCIPGFVGISSMLIKFAENWKEAQRDFFESFRNYDEAGSLQRIQVLKYLVLTTMLMGSDINPFDSQETKPYKNDHRIAAMTDLVDAYQRDDIHSYEKILQNNKDLLADPFIAENIDEVTRNMRTKAVLRLVAPYTRFSLSFISKQLKISLAEVQDIVSFLIVDKKLIGKINQHDGTVEVSSGSDIDRIRAVQDWTSAIGALCHTILNDGEGFRSDDNSGIGGSSRDVPRYGTSEAYEHVHIPKSGSGSGIKPKGSAVGGKRGGLSGRFPGGGSK